MDRVSLSAFFNSQNFVIRRGGPGGPIELQIAVEDRELGESNEGNTPPSFCSVKKE